MHPVQLEFLDWMTAAGALLLVMALSSSHIQRWPISTSILYLAAGLALGPQGLDWLRLDLPSHPKAMEHGTEIAVIISLFVGGLKLRLPLRDPAWVSVYRLAGPLMFLCILGVAACCHWLFGMPPALALLVGAILAPTDPVLAGAVAVEDARDRDRLSYALSGWGTGLGDSSCGCVRKSRKPMPRMICWSWR